jgi:CubicO group peptidase (beta-lactamase class C family)
MPEIEGIDKKEIEATMRETRIPGVSIAYLEGEGAVETTTVGKTDKHHVSPERAVNADTVFGAASLSKPVFTYLVLKLFEKGVLSREGESPESALDRPLHEILPMEEFFREQGKELSADDIERAKRITPRMILSHQSGLGIDGRAELDFEPGTEYAYSGISLMYLQKAIEHQTGKSIDLLAREEVFEPLGMMHSSFLPPKRPRYMAHTESSRAKSREVPKTPNAANSLHTTASEYTRLMKAWMSDPSPIMQQAFRPQISLREDKQKLPGEAEPAAKSVADDDKSHLAWGLGIGLELDDKDNAIKAFHMGDMNQYRSQVALDLKDKSCVAYFANGRDHKEANGHILGPLAITPKIPIPRAHRWFYEKFRFASHKDELIGGPNFGLRVPPPKPETGSYAKMEAMMPSRSEEPRVDREESKEGKQAPAMPSEPADAGREAEDKSLPSTPTPFRTTPKPPGEN